MFSSRARIENKFRVYVLASCWNALFDWNASQVGKPPTDKPNIHRGNNQTARV